MQFTLPGAPTIYYGDEIALDAPSQPDSGGNLQDDPYNRAPYPWPDEEGDAYSRDEDMLAFYQTLGTLRKEHPALREGERITLLADNDTGVLAYLRVDAEAGDAALVVINQSDVLQTATLDLAGFVPLALELEPSFSGEPIAVSEGPVTMTIRRSAAQSRAATLLTAPDAPTNLNAEAGRHRRWRGTRSPTGGCVIYRSPVERRLRAHHRRAGERRVCGRVSHRRLPLLLYRKRSARTAGRRAERPVGVTPGAAINERSTCGMAHRPAPLSLLEVGTLAKSAPRS